MIPKFRAWDKEENLWIKISSLGIDEEGEMWYLSPVMDGFNPVYYENELGKTWELMQSTGLKDKNDVEIFEGDVDRSESGEISVIVYLIKAGSYCVMPLEIYLNEDFQNANFFPELLYNFGYDCTFDNQISEKYLNIVGNIYENPELLEGR